MSDLQKKKEIQKGNDDQFEITLEARLEDGKAEKSAVLGRDQSPEYVKEAILKVSSSKKIVENGKPETDKDVYVEEESKPGLFDEVFSDTESEER